MECASGLQQDGNDQCQIHNANGRSMRCAIRETGEGFAGTACMFDVNLALKLAHLIQNSKKSVWNLDFAILLKRLRI